MVRCQDVPVAEAIVGSEGLPSSRDEPKHRYVVSHPWASKQHPDPDGVKLGALVEQLNLLNVSDEAGVFIDYMGLPQHDLQNEDLQRLELEGAWPKPGEHLSVRSEAEEVLFNKALESMEMLYSVGAIPVIVLPVFYARRISRDSSAKQSLSTDSSTSLSKHLMSNEYLSRGWCFLEVCLAFAYGNIANAGTDPAVRNLIYAVKRLNADSVEGFREAFKRTHFTCQGDATLVLQLFERTLKPKKARMSTAALLPWAPVAQSTTTG